MSTIKRSDEQPSGPWAATVKTRPSKPDGPPTSASATSAASAASAASTASPPTSSRLVFGLSSRTNRLKHDEYAEQRRAAAERQLNHQVGPIGVAETVSTTSATSATSSEPTKPSVRSAVRAGPAEEPAGQVVVVRRARRKSTEVAPEGVERESRQQVPVLGPASEQPRPKIRASKYGNFYKPQDLAQQQQQPVSASERCEQQVAVRSDKSRVQQQQRWQGSVDEPRHQVQVAGRGPAAEAGYQLDQSGAPKSSGQQVAGESGLPGRPAARRMARRRNVEEEPPSKNEPVSVSASRQAEEPPVVKLRTQFNVLPPPQLAMATTGKASMVSYAKSRIYDKPSKQQGGSSLLLNDSGPIPAAILSGRKPPKQVLVSKARERWEGGEPFAKCKSRQRLAAKAANKKLHLLGSWSMSSVVATQQLQLQSALAQSSASVRSRPSQSDPSVKILARGSVLERVQQFERAPVARSASLSGATSLLDDDDEGDLLEYDEGPLRRSASASSIPLRDEAEEEQRRPGSPSIKQAQYKSRVSSIQQQEQQQVASAPVSAAKASQTAQASGQGQPARRSSLGRRRSSLLGRRNSSTSIIPKFHHPNGKPNTYEIEIQKRNIVAAFDKLPERRAQVSGPLARRHFHQVALACGLSEYWKLPLQLYVEHLLASDEQLVSNGNGNGGSKLPNGLPNPGPQRKTSATMPLTNGTSNKSPQATGVQRSNSLAQQPSNRAGLVKAASVDGDKVTTPPGQISYVSCDQFLACWRKLIGCAYDKPAQFIHLLTLGQRDHLQPDDLVPLIQSIIDDHPGLKFLRAAPDFHLRYIQTVIARIYFSINRSWTGKITLGELRRSNLLAVLQVLGQEEDINQVVDYFSYEHFYVIYCKFWNLDQDHDLFISQEDLAKHNDAAISSRIIERVFSGAVSKQIKQTGKMSYADFVWFLIAEEDKKQPRSIEYWFRLMDLDGDGYISMYEMEYFYYEQIKRLEMMNIEALPFLDSACQILDLVNPREKNKISLADLKRTKMATIFFDTFINLEKYLEHESREFVSTRDLVQDGVVISDWDRYASEEYENLVTEESAV